MRSLYEINNDLRAFLDNGFDEECVDPETGEFDEAAAARKLAALEVEFAKKIEGIALYVQELTVQASALGEKIAALKERKTALDKKAEKLETMIADALGSKPFATDTVEIKFRKSNPLYVDESVLADKWWRITQKREPDKTAIKDAIKNGEKIIGAEIQEKYNIQIK